MKIRTALLTTALFAATATTALAQYEPYNEFRGPTINERQARQEARIQRGIDSGQLTRFEARQLMREQREIRRAERHAKADGVLTSGERAYIDSLQDQAGREIARQMRDDQFARWDREQRWNR